MRTRPLSLLLTSQSVCLLLLLLLHSRLDLKMLNLNSPQLGHANFLRLGVAHCFCPSGQTSGDKPGAGGGHTDAQAPGLPADLGPSTRQLNLGSFTLVALTQGVDNQQKEGGTMATLNEKSQVDTLSRVLWVLA